jgi:hypothetical protein
MSKITGTYRTELKPLVAFDAEQDGERWRVTVRSAAERYEASTWQPSPWACIERLVGDALDGVNREVEPPKYDMNKKLARPLTPTPLRRRGKLPPGSVPEWRPPEN